MAYSSSTPACCWKRLKVPSGTVDAARVRLANYYLGQLRLANSVYGRGHESSAEGLTLFDRDWPHIKQWHAWAESRADRDPVAAGLCREYAERGAGILSLRLTAIQQIDWLESALKVVKTQADPRAEMWCLYRIAEAHNKQGSFELAEEYGVQSLVLARGLGEKYCIGLNICLYAESERRIGNYANARRLFEESLTILRKLRVLYDVGRAYRGLGLVAWHEGEFAQATEYHKRHLAIAIDLGADADMCDAFLNLSLPLWVTGDRAAAQEYLERCIARCRAIGYQRTLASALNTSGQTFHEMGSLADARRQYEEAVAIARSHGYLKEMADYQTNLADVLTLMGDGHAALGLLDEANELARSQGWKRQLGEGLTLAASALVALKDFENASRSLREASRIALDLDNKIFNLHVILTGIDVLNTAGRVETAAEWAGSVLSLGELPAGENAFIISTCDKMRSALGQERFDSALERGKSLATGAIIHMIAHGSDAFLLKADHALDSSELTLSA